MAANDTRTVSRLTGVSGDIGAAASRRLACDGLATLINYGGKTSAAGQLVQDEELGSEGPTHRIAVAVHPSLLANALQETPHNGDVGRTERGRLTELHMMAVVRAMTVDLDSGSTAGRLYGDSLANTLALYLLSRYAVRLYTPAVQGDRTAIQLGGQARRLGGYKGGLPGYRLKRVLDHIRDNLSNDLSIAQLAAIAGMSPHYFAELFRRSTGRAPHQYVLLQRIERAKESLRDPRHSVIEAGLDAGFVNPSHFARIFRKLVGMSPSVFRSEINRVESTRAQSPTREGPCGVTDFARNR
jgi:AraC family transcriptional regulator